MKLVLIICLVFLATFSSAAITIGDFVWCDTNGDGIQDFGEPGISGVSVEIYTMNNILLGYSMSDSSGYFLLDEDDNTDPLFRATQYTLRIRDAGTTMAALGNCDYPTLAGEGDEDDSSIGLDEPTSAITSPFIKAEITTSSTQDANSGCDFGFTDPSKK